MNPAIENYIDSHDDDMLARLKAFLTIPSVSTASEHSADVREACAFVRDQLQGIGIDAEILDTDRHPVVLADSGPSNGPTILVYGHYDVQPTGDLTLWNSKPFEPVVKDGALFGRGSADDKGQVMCHLMAAEAWKKTAGSLPCRVKYLIEGEEEIGSPSLAALVAKNRERLACDLVLLSDTGKLSPEIPAITYGTMGLVYKEIRLYGPKQNLHSGTFGGTVANPGNVLAGMLAALKEENQRVAIPGFYDDVVDVSPEERADLNALPFEEAEYLASLGSPALCGEAGYTTVERKWIRPKLDINGMFGGYEGEGAMTVVPAMCGAKVSMRIVPNQDPSTISRLFDEYVRELCPESVRMEIDEFAAAGPYVTPLEHPGVQAATTALEQAYGTRPALIREGGTIPIMALFKEELGAESILMGFADPHCNVHGPNEFFHVTDLIRGTKAAANFLSEIARSEG